MLWISLAAAFVFAAAFAFGRNIHVSTWKGKRAWISFAAGASIAYVFVYLMPELSSRQMGIASDINLQGIPFATAIVFLVAMGGFIFFYGMDNLVFTRRSPGHAQSFKHQSPLVYRLHLLGFAVNCAIAGYLLVDWRRPLHSLLLYVIAIGLHFLVIDHSLRDEYGPLYDRHGRWALAASCIMGWAIGALVILPYYVISLLIGFISGGVTFNSIKDELPARGEGRLIPFMIGAIAYAGIVLFI